MLTIGQILKVSWPYVATCMGSNRYMLGEIQEIARGTAYLVYLKDLETMQTVPITWTLAHEVEHATEEKKVKFVKTLLVNAVRSMSLMNDTMVE